MFYACMIVHRSIVGYAVLLYKAGSLFNMDTAWSITVMSITVMNNCCSVRDAKQHVMYASFSSGKMAEPASKLTVHVQCVSHMHAPMV